MIILLQSDLGIYTTLNKIRYKDTPPYFPPLSQRASLQASQDRIPTAVSDVQVSDVQEQNKKNELSINSRKVGVVAVEGIVCVCAGGGGGALGGERVPLKEIYFPIGERYDNTSS